MAVRGKTSTAEKRIFAMVTAVLALTGAEVILPYFAGELGVGRFYHITLFFASASFVYGVNAVDSGLANVRQFVSRRLPGMRVTSYGNRSRRLAASILFLYFLFASGWVYAISYDKPVSFLLDHERMKISPDPSLREYYYSYFTMPEDIASARWLRSNLVNGIAVCADFDSAIHVLTSYGGLTIGDHELPSTCEFGNSYIYLSMMNTVGGIGYGTNETGKLYIWPVSEISSKLTAKNLIYSSGASVIYA
jgi:uncharacterized membrane protein